MGSGFPIPEHSVRGIPDVPGLGTLQKNRGVPEMAFQNRKIEVNTPLGRSGIGVKMDVPELATLGVFQTGAFQT